MEKEPLSWEALEYEHKEKGRDWYWAIGIITFSTAVIAAMLGNYVFSLVLIVSGFALGVASSRKPKIVSFELKKTGISIEGKFMPYGSIKSFWVENNIHHDGISKLIFKPRHGNAHLIVIPIEDVHPEDVRDYLIDMLLEEELSEPFLQKVAEYFGF
jgi:hypothetical protein